MTAEKVIQGQHEEMRVISAKIPVGDAEAFRLLAQRLGQPPGTLLRHVVLFVLRLADELGDDELLLALFQESAKEVKA